MLRFVYKSIKLNEFGQSVVTSFEKVFLEEIRRLTKQLVKQISYFISIEPLAIWLMKKLGYFGCNKNYLCFMENDNLTGFDNCLNILIWFLSDFMGRISHND